MNFAVSTFCYGNRYYSQVNRMIESFLILDEKPNVFVVTDNPNAISKYNFVFTDHINNYNQKYTEYNTNYYDFDFSVKRFSLKFALDNGYTRIILSDADSVADSSRFNQNNIDKCFSENTVSGPVNFILEKEMTNNSMLGQRLKYYENQFGVSFDKTNMLVSEDCVQYFDISKESFNKFLDTWEECIKIKYTNNLPNIPAGNIDEITFSALYNNIKLNNNSEYAVNILTQYHDKWYC